MQLLFDTPEAAREVAFMLQCAYDGFTMITLPPIHDTLALRTAIDLTGADFCFAGDHYPLVLASTADALRPVSDQHSADRISRKAELWQEIRCYFYGFALLAVLWLAVLWRDFNRWNAWLHWLCRADPRFRWELAVGHWLIHTVCFIFLLFVDLLSFHRYFISCEPIKKVFADIAK